MAQGFQADSCSTTAQTSAGSSDCAKAALRASAMSWAGNAIVLANSTACGLLTASALAAGVEIDELDERRFVELNSLLRGDFQQRGVDVRQMIGGDVAHEGAGDFVVAHAAVHPAQEDYELHRDGNKCCEPAGRGG